MPALELSPNMARVLAETKMREEALEALSNDLADVIAEAHVPIETAERALSLAGDKIRAQTVASFTRP